MSRVSVTIGIAALLGLMSGCSPMQPREAAVERVIDPIKVAQYNLELERRARIEAEARRRGIILIWANAPMKPYGVSSDET